MKNAKNTTKTIYLGSIRNSVNNVLSHHQEGKVGEKTPDSFKFVIIGDPQVIIKKLSGLSFEECIFLGKCK